MLRLSEMEKLSRHSRVLLLHFNGVGGPMFPPTNDIDVVFNKHPMRVRITSAECTRRGPNLKLR